MVFAWPVLGSFIAARLPESMIFTDTAVSIGGLYYLVAQSGF